MAARAVIDRMTAETTTTGLRRSLTHGERGSVIQGNTTIEQTIKEIDHQIEEDQKRAVDDHDTREQKSVPVQHGIHKKAAGSGDTEDAFDDDRAGQQIGSQRP